MREERQASLNNAFWTRGEHVEFYAGLGLRPVERQLLQAYRGDLSAGVLELGCGAGRLTRALCEISPRVHGIDISEAMVAYCRTALPQGTFSVGDLRDLAWARDGSLEAVVAPFNVLDVLDDPGRAEVLEEIHRILAEDGLLIMSSHNRAYSTGSRVAILRQLVGSLRDPRAGIAQLPRRLRNRRRLRRMQRIGEGKAIINDEAHDFSVLHYYISRDVQEAQLREHGFELLECRDLDGATVAPGATAAHCSELHYVARRRSA